MTWRLAFALLAACTAAPTSTPVQPQIAPETTTTTAPEVARPVAARLDLEVPTKPTSIAVKGSTLLWTDSDGAIWTMASDGSGMPTQLSDAGSPNFAFHLFEAGDGVFATSRGDVLRVETNGAVRELGLGRRGDLPEESVGDASALYVTLFKRSQILRIPTGGGESTTLAEVQRGVLGLYGKTLYVASYTAGTLVAIPTRGGAPITIASNLPKPTAVAADATAVFVYCERDKDVRRIDLANGKVQIIASDLENSDVLVVDGSYVYTVTWGRAPGLVRIPRDGSHAAERLTTDLESPNAIAIDATAVYVSSRKERRIVKLSKQALPRH